MVPESPHIWGVTSGPGLHLKKKRMELLTYQFLENLFSNEELTDGNDD
jgi:hypothetical protein